MWCKIEYYDVKSNYVVPIFSIGHEIIVRPAKSVGELFKHVSCVLKGPGWCTVYLFCYSTKSLRLKL